MKLTHLLAVSVTVALLSGSAAGQVVPTYIKPTRADYRQAAAAFESIQLLERIAAGVNTTVRMPTRTPLLLQECGNVNAYYTPPDEKHYLVL